MPGRAAAATGLAAATGVSTGGTVGARSTPAVPGSACPRTSLATCAGPFRVPQVSDMTRLPLRQCEIEGGTFAHLAFGPHATAMPANDTLDDGESGAGAGEILG